MELLRLLILLQRGLRRILPVPELWRARLLLQCAVLLLELPISVTCAASPGLTPSAWHWEASCLQPEKVGHSQQMDHNSGYAAVWWGAAVDKCLDLPSVAGQMLQFS